MTVDKFDYKALHATKEQLTGRLVAGERVEVLQFVISLVQFLGMKHTTATKGGTTTYVFQVEVVHEEDGRWSAGVPSLPGCATWGHTREEALHNIHDAVTAYIRDLQKAGEEIPQGAATEVITETVVTVTV